VSGDAPDGEADPLLPDDWASLEPLLDQLLDAPPEERPALLEVLGGGNPARRAALARMLAECERDWPLLDAVAAERFDTLTAEPGGPLLPELVGDRYRLGRELGRGGMARVYLAHDTKHGRDVAIKVIRPELSVSLGHDRFLREIEIAARLRHPNIVPLYDSGEVAGTLYFVMPFEDGPSLRERLRVDGAFAIPDALGILRDVARALAHAHAHGVVHRDVKPDNVMLSGGAAVVTDFGIAKAVSAALSEASAPTLSQTGMGLGTPAYMAPEQAMGDPATDHRADIYAFGCLAFELLTGAPPFAEPSVHQIVAAHLTRLPRPLSDVRPEVPASISELVARCLAKLPDERPQNVRDVLGVLDGSANASPVASSPTARMQPVVAPSRRALVLGVAAIAAILIGVAGLAYSLRPVVAAPISLAVLPFGNTAADSSMEFVLESLSDEVAASLMYVPGIQVKSRAGARLFRGQLGVDVIEAGQKLKADYVMTGVVRQDRGRWILSADLARASDGSSIWADVFPFTAEQQAGAVDLIDRSLLSTLRSLFPGAIGSATAAASEGTTSNSEAYRFYLRGMVGLNRRGLSVKQSAEMFRLAIREDSSFARAWSGLSMALALFPYFENVPARGVIDEVTRTAQRALSLAPSLAQPHIALAIAHQYAFQWDSAEVELRAAIARDARDVEARVQYARFFRLFGRHAEALEQLRLARFEDPASALVLSQLAYELYLDGQVDSALAESRRSIENDSTNLTSIALSADILVQNGRMAEAERLIRKLPYRMVVRPFLLSRIGQGATVQQELDALDEKSSREFQATKWRAYAYLGLGDTTRSIDAFERVAADDELWPIMHSFDDPLFAPLLRYPRYAAILERAGLSALVAKGRQQR